MKSKQRLLPLLLAAVILTGLLTPFLALGQGETIVTIAVPEWMTDVFNDDLFADFEAQHPGVNVLAVSAGNQIWYDSPYGDIEAHLDGAQEYSQLADVLYIQSYNLTPEATLGGSYLDLTPLVMGDNALNAADFFPPVWESFQWDNKVWALPVGASPIVLLYDALQFDEAGLAYPTGDWSLEDLLTNAAALTTYDADGDVIQPGFLPGNAEAFVRAIYGRGLYDPATLPNMPVLNDPELVPLLERYYDMQERGEVAGGDGNFDYENIPMVISQPFQLFNPMVEGHEWQAALLPGNAAGLDVAGFAISRGSVNPEMAYELAKYLTYSPDVVMRLFSTHPARQSLVGVDPAEAPAFNFLNFLDENEMAILDEAMNNAFSVSETRFVGYLVEALRQMTEDGLDAQSALFAAEQLAHDNIAAAQARGTDAVVYVATPVPTPVLAAEESALTFGLLSMMMPLPNRDEWDAQIDAFVAGDPQVGHIELITNPNIETFEEFTDQVDCFFISGNVTANVSLNTILDLAPLLAADPTFDLNDVLPGTMQQVQRDNHTWGLPVILQPAVLLYDENVFADAGVVTPDGGWTVDAFTEAMRNVAYVSESNDPVLDPRSYGNTYMLMLMAAYGGLPVDFRTDPPTVNVSDPVTLDAIQQALDLAKDGLINYQALDNMGGSFGGGSNDAPIFTDVFNAYSASRYLLDDEEGEESEESGPAYRVTTFPTGSQYTPLAHDVAAAYISAKTQHPEACYRWISELSRLPHLFYGMPARYSLLDDPTVSAAYGPDLMDFYRRYGTMLQQPDAIALPSMQGGSLGTVGSMFEMSWLDQAFDAYVLENGDLEADLAMAGQNITAFRECTATLPPAAEAGQTQEEQLDYFRLFLDCAGRIDPDLAERFGWIDNL